MTPETQLMFHRLFNAYYDRCVGNLHPTILVVNPVWEEEYLKYASILGTSQPKRWAKFMQADVLVDPNEPSFRFIGGYEPPQGE